jgi:hypothetical protein
MSGNELIRTNNFIDPNVYEEILPDDYDSINKIQKDAIKYGLKI